MSVPDAPGPSAPEPPRQFRLVAALMILAGAVLLLPGICALVSAVMMLSMSNPEALLPLGALWALCLLISYGGIRLIARGTRG